MSANIINSNDTALGKFTKILTIQRNVSEYKVLYSSPTKLFEEIKKPSYIKYHNLKNSTDQLDFKDVKYISTKINLKNYSLISIELILFQYINSSLKEEEKSLVNKLFDNFIEKCLLPNIKEIDRLDSNLSENIIKTITYNMKNKEELPLDEEWDWVRYNFFNKTMAIFMKNIYISNGEIVHPKYKFEDTTQLHIRSVEEIRGIPYKYWHNADKFDINDMHCARTLSSTMEFPNCSIYKFIFFQYINDDSTSDEQEALIDKIDKEFIKYAENNIIKDKKQIPIGFEWEKRKY